MIVIPDRKINKGRNRILRPKLHLKSGIIHALAEVVAILFFLFTMTAR